MSEFNQRIVQGFAWEAGTRIIVQIASWISTIWVARLLSPDDYGLVATSGIFTGLCLTFSVMGLSNALINKKSIEDYDKANVFWASAVTSLIIYFSLYFISSYIAKIYETAELEKIIRVAGLMVIISPLSIVPRALMMRALRFKEISLISLATNLFVTISTLYLAFSGWGYWSLILSTVSAQFIELIILMRISRYIPQAPKNISTIYPLYKYGVNILGARLVSYLNDVWPVIFFSSLLGKTQTGHFQMAGTLASMPMSKIGDIFSRIAFPAFSQIQDDSEKTKRVFLGMHRYLFMVVAPMFVGIALTATEFIPIILGEKWIPSIIPLQIICFANILAGSALIIPRVLEGLGAANWSFRYQIFIAIITPCVMALGIPWGLNGMLIAWALSRPISYYYLLTMLFKLTGLRFEEFVQSVSVTCLCVALMLGFVISVDWFLAGRVAMLELLVIKVFAGAVSYMLAYLIFGREHIWKLAKLLESRGAAR